MKAKITKDGKVSLKLDNALWEILESAVERRMLRYGFDLEVFAWALLREILLKLRLKSGAVIRLRESEFFALFHAHTMENIDEPTQILLKEFIAPLYKEILSPTKNRRS